LDLTDSFANICFFFWLCGSRQSRGFHPYAFDRSTTQATIPHSSSQWIGTGGQPQTSPHIQIGTQQQMQTQSLPPPVLVQSRHFTPQPTQQQAPFQFAKPNLTPSQLQRDDVVK
jgi:hypothetical protein